MDKTPSRYNLTRGPRPEPDDDLPPAAQRTVPVVYTESAFARHTRESRERFEATMADICRGSRQTYPTRWGTDEWADTAGGRFS